MKHQSCPPGIDSIIGKIKTHYRVKFMEGQKETVGLGETKDKIIRVLEKEIIQKEGSKREKAACEAVFKR